MMHDAAVPRTNLNSLNVFVFNEMGRYCKVDIFITTLSADLKLLRHREHDIRLTNTPAFNKRSWRGKISRIALRRPAFDPSADRLNFQVAEPPIIGKFANIRICMPWR